MVQMAINQRKRKIYEETIRLIRIIQQDRKEKLLRKKMHTYRLKVIFEKLFSLFIHCAQASSSRNSSD